MRPIFLSSLFKLLSILLLCINVAVAQTAESTAVEQLPETLTQESVANFLSILSDKEVRELLKKQLDGLAAEQQQQPQQSITQSLDQAITQMGSSFAYTFSVIPNLFANLNRAYQTFRADRATVPFLFKFIALFVLGLIIALATEKTGDLSSQGA